MTGTDCGLFTHNQSRSYLNHLVSTEIHVDADKKLKLWILEKKNQLEAVKYISDITLATQTNWHSNNGQ